MILRFSPSIFGKMIVDAVFFKLGRCFACLGFEGREKGVASKGFFDMRDVEFFAKGRGQGDRENLRAADHEDVFDRGFYSGGLGDRILHFHHCGPRADQS